MTEARIIPKSINVVYGSDGPADPSQIPIASGNPKKREEIAYLVGRTPDEMNFTNVADIEMQGMSPEKVSEEKARRAFIENGNQPTLIEDVSLHVAELADSGRYAPPHVKFWARTREDRRELCNELTRKGLDRSIQMRVDLVLFDGKNFHRWSSVTNGKIPDQPTGSSEFGFDDIIVPNEQKIDEEKGEKPRTYAEMTLDEKNQTSPRARAFAKFQANPPMLDKVVFQLPEPYAMQINAVRWERLEQHPTAMQHAFNLAVLGRGTIDYANPNERIPYKAAEIAPGSEIYRYALATEFDGPDAGTLIGPMHRAVDQYGVPYRLQLDARGEPIFWSPSPKEVEMAVAARAHEFAIWHNEEMYEYLRAMMRGEIKTTPRSNRRDYVVEEAIRMKKKKQSKDNSEFVEIFNEDDYEVLGTAANTDTGYVRQYSPDELMSRTATKGLIVDTGGVPSSILGLGGMPPTTGWVDVLSTASLSFMDCYIPHSGVFADDYDRQLELFLRAKEQIQSYGLPEDIEDLVIAHIGLSVKSEDIEKIGDVVEKFHKHGCRLFRVYTTNPDHRVTDTAREIRKRTGVDARQDPRKGTRVAVGTVVSFKAAKALLADDIKANIVLAGHAVGQNCTSGAGGLGDNSTEILYKESLDKAFNDVAIGREAGNGDEIGLSLGFLDRISLNQSGIGAGIEASGGLYVEFANGRIGLINDGTASPYRQWEEVVLQPHLAEKRLNDAAELNNDEGKTSIMIKSRHIKSIVQTWWQKRSLIGRTLADRRSGGKENGGISRLRELIRDEEPENRLVYAGTANLLKPHQPNS